MRVSIVGDSFAHYYQDTYLENIVDECGFVLSEHIGLNGCSQFQIYRNFLTVLRHKPDIIICCHTQHSRLYHSRYIIHQNSKHNIIDEKLLPIVDGYYAHLYEDDYAKFTHTLLIDKMQSVCKENQIKMINFACFSPASLNKTYGLWIVSPNGLSQCAKVDGKIKHNDMFNDTRKNHFTEKGHKILADLVIPHIKTYINSTQESHIVQVFPELFS